MAVAAFTRWEAEGRPIEPAQPVREMVEALKKAFPEAAGTFSWYADAAHYEADYPEDHTPYSVTAWPDPDPEWFVFATDVMHRPDLGVDCNILFEYWIGEARAGRFPSLKYIIWKQRIYDVRNNWEPTYADDHDDHIHLSFRTDYLSIGFGTWNPVGGPMWDEQFDNPSDPGKTSSTADFLRYANHYAFRAANAAEATLAAVRVILENIEGGVQVSAKVDLTDSAQHEVAAEVVKALAGELAD